MRRSRPVQPDLLSAAAGLGDERARGPASTFPPGYGGPFADDFEIVRERLLRWPRAEHAALLRLPPAELRHVYEAILYMDARPKGEA